MRRSHSFETVESCSLDSVTMATSNLQATEDVLSNWSASVELVSENTDDDALGEPGILIVSSIQENEAEIQARTNDTSTLSIPDSVPTNVGDLSSLQHQQHQQHHQQQGSVSSSGTTTTPSQPTILTRVAMALAFVGFLLLCVSPALVVMREREEMRAATMRLEHQIRLLSQKIEQDKHQLQPPPQQFHWEDDPQPTCGGSPNRIDNCWVHAEANFELGECARKTKKKVKKGLVHIGNKLWRAQEEFIVHMRDIKDQYAESSNIFQQQQQQQHKTTTTTKEEPQDTAVMVKPKDRMQRIGKEAGKVLTAFAFASAAALVVSAGFILGGGDDDE